MLNFEKLSNEEILKEIDLLDNTLTNINNEVLKDELKKIALVYISLLKPVCFKPPIKEKIEPKGIIND